MASICEAVKNVVVSQGAVRGCGTVGASIAGAAFIPSSSHLQKRCSMARAGHPKCQNCQRREFLSGRSEPSFDHDPTRTAMPLPSPECGRSDSGDSAILWTCESALVPTVASSSGQAVHALEEQQGRSRGRPGRESFPDNLAHSLPAVHDTRLGPMGRGYCDA